MKLHLTNWRLVLAAFLFPNIISAQVWTQTSAPTNNWQSIACSADGSKLVAAVDGGGIYTSTNFGGNWTSNNLPSMSWNSVASSADGNKLAAAVFSGGIYTSTNAGTTWISNNLASKSWNSIASSADGSILVATYVQNYVTGQNFVIVSTNAGAIWFSNQAPAGGPGLYGVNLSASGSRLAAGINTGSIMVSSNLGKSWLATNNLNAGSFKSIVSSADGGKLAAVYGGATVFTSANAGISWTNSTISSADIVSVTISADGNKLSAFGSIPSMAAYVFISTNLGITWITNVQSVSGWKSIATSADGNRLAAVVYRGGIWVAQTMPSPRLNFTTANAALKVSWMVPSTNFVIQQSTDFQNWTDATNAPTLNLTNLQNEIVLPSAGGNYFYRLKTP